MYKYICNIYIYIFFCMRTDIRVHICVCVCMTSNKIIHTSYIIMQESDDPGIQDTYFASFFHKQADAFP